MRLVLPSVLLALAASASGLPAADFFVAPDGKDTWSGRLAAPKPDGSDGPLASLAGARDAVRRLKAKGPLDKPILVLLRGGKYTLSQPVQFSADDSGTKDAPITYAAYPDEKPILTGGVPITGWRKGEGPLWTTVVPEVKAGRWYFRSLFVDGKRAAPARTPNEGANFSARPIKPIDRKSPPESETNAAVPAGPALPGRSDQALVEPGRRDRGRLSRLDHFPASHRLGGRRRKIVHFTNPSGFPVGWWDKPRYYVENVREALDAPGEFYLDRKTGVLSYYPRPGEDMTKAEVIAPRPEVLLRLEGDAAHGHPIEHLRLEGIAFEYTDWVMPPKAVVDGQSAMFLKTATVMIRGARHCTVERCEIVRTSAATPCGSSAAARTTAWNSVTSTIWRRRRAAGRTVAAAQRRPEQSERNQVVNCFIHDGGRVYHMGVGVWIGQSSYNKVLHNEICDFLNIGVSVGWSWGYAPTTAHHNAVEYNHIHHLGYGQLSDMGGVYTLGVSPGTTVRYNLVHDVLAFTLRRLGAVSRRGQHRHPVGEQRRLSRQRRLRPPALRPRQHDSQQHLGLRHPRSDRPHAATRRTARSSASGTSSTTRKVSRWATISALGQQQFDYNCYWNPTGKPPMFPGGLSFQQWQAKRQDVHSIIADPKFFDAGRFDFRLKADSPALQAGLPADRHQRDRAGRSGRVGRTCRSTCERPRLKLPGDK